MSRSILRIPAFLRSSVSLALAAAMVVGAGAAETAKGSAGAAGALSITTEPDNADVYVDGRLAGQTPANVASLAAGEHRVRIVKSGYLENARVVTLTAGEPAHLNVKLTRTTGVSNETAAGQVTSTGGASGGGGSKKWLWIGLAGAGAAAVAVAAMPHNKAPVPGTITASPTGTGMAGQTSFTFTSTGASDPDGDTLTKTWTSSDGGSGTGDTFTRTFATAGSFQVNLKVSDGKLEASTPAASATVGPNLTGTWTGATEPGFSCPISLSLTQSGTTISGTRSWVGACSGTNNLASGSASVLTHPSAVTLVTIAFTVNGLPGQSFTERYAFNTDTGGTSMTGTITTTRVQDGLALSGSGTLRKQ
jgi:hypothetical protein